MVLEFKAGLEDQAHAKQVRQYAQALRQMGYPGVDAFVVYVMQPTLVPVPLSSEVTAAA